MELPKKIQQLIDDETYKIDEVGMSGSSVFLFQDKVLKIQPYCGEAENEYRIMKWLQGKIPVPRVLAWEVWHGRTYLVMSRCDGKMACDEEYMHNPAAQVRLLAAGLKMLWQTDISACPSDQSLSISRTKNRSCPMEITAFPMYLEREAASWA